MKVGCACITTIIGLIIVGLITFASLRIYRTLSDSRHLSFSITHASVSSFNISPTHLQANFDLMASLKNPDKNSYDDVHAALFYPSNDVEGGKAPTIIAETSLESFSMEQENNAATSLSKYINLVADKELDPAAASAIARDKAVTSTVGFTLNFSARDMATTAKWRLWRRTVHVVCQGIIINFDRPDETMGLLMKHPINCDVQV